MQKNIEENSKNKSEIFLIECPICQTQISSTASRCYNCGNIVDNELTIKPQEQPSVGNYTETDKNNTRNELNVPAQINDRDLSPQSNSLSKKSKSSSQQPSNIEGELSQTQSFTQFYQPISSSDTNVWELDAIRSALEREQKDKAMLRTELEIKNAEIKMFEEQDQKLRKLEQIKEMMDTTILEKNRLTEELNFQKKRNEEMEKYVASMQYLEQELDKKDAYIKELVDEASEQEKAIKKYKTKTEELEEKKRNIQYLKSEIIDLKDRLKNMETTTKRDEQLKGIRQILEKETKRKEKLQQELNQLDNIRNLLKNEKKEKEKLQEEIDFKDRELGELEQLNELVNVEKKECIRLRNELSRMSKIEEVLKKEEWNRKNLEESIKLKDDKINALNTSIEKLDEKLSNLKKLESVLSEERNEKEKIVAEYNDKMKYIHDLEIRLVELESHIPQVTCPACKTPISIDAKSCPNCHAEFGDSFLAIDAKTGKALMSAEDYQYKMQNLQKRQKEVENVFKDLKEKEKLYNGKWETLKFKEEELTRRENEIAIKTSSMEEEKNFLSSLKNEMKDTTSLVRLNEELQTIKNELRLKEEELRDRERHLSLKMREQEIREGEMGNARFDSFEIPDTETLKTASGTSMKTNTYIVKIK